VSGHVGVGRTVAFVCNHFDTVLRSLGVEDIGPTGSVRIRVVQNSDVLDLCLVTEIHQDALNYQDITGATLNSHFSVGCVTAVPAAMDTGICFFLRWVRLQRGAGAAAADDGGDSFLVDHLLTATFAFAGSLSSSSMINCTFPR